MIRRSWVGMLLVGLLASSCGRVGYQHVHDQSLIVTTAADRLAGPDTMSSPSELDPGAEGLSLREALVIAANASGSDLITFDRDVFVEGSPAVITVGSALPPVSDPTTVDGSGTGVVVEGTATAEPVLQITAAGSTVRGLELRKSGGDAMRIAADGVTVAETTILDAAGRGILAETCEGLSLTANRIERAGATLISVADCTDVTIHDNVLVIGDKDALRGIHLERVTDSRVTANLVDPGSARLVDLQESSNNEIVGNILDRGHAGVVLEGDSHDNFVFRNRIIGSEYDGVYVSSASSGNTVVHNTMLECSTPIADGAADTVLGNNLESEDPSEFVDAGSYDLHLVEGSPHIDAGEDLGYDCLPNRSGRYLGDAPDLGAVESY